MTLPPEVETKVMEIGRSSRTNLLNVDWVDSAREMAEWLMQEVCRRCGEVVREEPPLNDCYDPDCGHFLHDFIVTRAEYIRRKR